LRRPARRQKIKQIVLDGEIVALGEDGRPSFQSLQHGSAHPRHEIVFYVFDLLYADGRDSTGDPLEVRRPEGKEWLYEGRGCPRS
jgi:bifunctional non-homologous end joining protein LigD